LTHSYPLVLKSEINNNNNNNNNNKMMKLTVVVIALFCTVHKSEAYFKLFGNLAESNGFPHPSLSRDFGLCVGGRNHCQQRTVERQTTNQSEKAM